MTTGFIPFVKASGVTDKHKSDTSVCLSYFNGRFSQDVWRFYNQCGCLAVLLYTEPFSAAAC